MRNDRKNEAIHSGTGCQNGDATGAIGVQHPGGSNGMAGSVPDSGQFDGEQRTIPSGLHDSARAKGIRKRDFLSSIERDAKRGPEYDPIAGEQWPCLQECLSCTFTKDSKPRAGGEVKTVAVGYNYRTSLVMPEEGVQVSVVHNALSKAWDALEHVLCLEPVPWVECSEFAVRRAKQRGKKKEEKKVD
jgi:hypothetical protein